jgi:hypothetical protein
MGHPVNRDPNDFGYLGGGKQLIGVPSSYEVGLPWGGRYNYYLRLRGEGGGKVGSKEVQIALSEEQDYCPTSGAVVFLPLRWIKGFSAERTCYFAHGFPLLIGGPGRTLRVRCSTN